MRLHELRKRPEVNRKLTTVEKLAEYAADPSLNASFSPLMKIGIYPISDWDTPNGVYAYQLNQYKSMLDADQQVDKIFPFGYERPYIFVLKNIAKNPLNFDKELPDDVFRKSLDILYETLDTPAEQRTYGIPGASRYRYHNNSQVLYAIMRRNVLEGNMRTNTFNAILRKCGFDAVIDNGHGVLHSGLEPIQIVFLTPTAYKMVDLVYNDSIHREDRHHVYGTAGKGRRSKRPDKGAEI